MLFSAIDGKQTVIRNAKTGVYKQAHLYERKGEMYAGVAGGFIRLMAEGRTSHPSMLWDDIEAKFEIAPGVMRNLKYIEEMAVQ